MPAEEETSAPVEMEGQESAIEEETGLVYQELSAKTGDGTVCVTVKGGLPEAASVTIAPVTEQNVISRETALTHCMNLGMLQKRLGT